MRTFRHPFVRYMALAIAEAHKNVKRPCGGPFGACIVQDTRVLAIARNTVLRDRDPTCHAEINAIRLAVRRIRSHVLTGCVIYSTTEPCPMCFSAIHWARISTVVWGTSIADVARLGFNEMKVSSRRLRVLSGSPFVIIPRFAVRECQSLLKEWAMSPRREVY